MDDATNSEAAREPQDGPEADRADKDGQAEAQANADRAAEGLRGQIAALRQQVRDAQETLRDHQRQRETRTFKR